MITKRVVITEQKREPGAKTATIHFDGITEEGTREYGTYGAFRVTPEDLATFTIGLTASLVIDNQPSLFTDKHTGENNGTANCESGRTNQG